MQIFCTVQTTNHNNHQSGNVKAVKSKLAIGKTPHKTDPEAYILHFTDVNKVGTRYNLKNNIENVFCKFVNEGKITIRFKAPPHDLGIKGDSVQLKCFLKTLKMVLSGQQPLTEIKLSNLSTTLSQSKRPVTKLAIRSRAEYPVKGLPRTVEHLTIVDLKLCQFNQQILQLRKLKVLDLSNNCITKLPPALGNLEHLQELYLSNNKLNEGKLNEWEWLNGVHINKTLKMLDLSNNNLKVLPYHIFKLQELIKFKLNNNQLQMLPPGIGRMRKLLELHLCNNKLVYLPASIVNMRLDLLDMTGNLRSDEDQDSKNVKETKKLTLLEIAARSVLKNRVDYTPATLPRSICNYLDQATWCICSNFIVQRYCSFETCSRTVGFLCKTLQTDLPNMHLIFKYDLCSLKCYNLAQRKLPRPPQLQNLLV